MITPEPAHLDGLKVSRIERPHTDALLRTQRLHLPIQLGSCVAWQRLVHALHEAADRHLLPVLDLRLAFLWMRGVLQQLWPVRRCSVWRSALLRVGVEPLELKERLVDSRLAENSSTPS